MIESKRNEVIAFLEGAFMTSDIDSMDIEEATFSYAAIKALSDALEEKKKLLRERLLNDPEAAEDLSSSSSKVIGRHKLSRTLSLKRYTDMDKLRQLLKEKEISETAVVDTIVKPTIKKVINPSKIEKLVEVGSFTEEEAESLHKKQWSLRVAALKGRK